MLWPIQNTGTTSAVTWQHTASFVKVAVSGEPTLDEFLALVGVIADDTPSWEHPALLFDLRGVRRVFSYAEQYRLGEETARSLYHLRGIASVVPEEWTTGLCARTANQNGGNVRVFTCELEALDWLLDVPQECTEA